MLGLLKVAALLASGLQLVLAVASDTVPVSNGEDTTSGSLMTLELGGISNNSALQQATIDLRVFESTIPCGRGYIAINGMPLAQDDLGFGSGSITTSTGSVLAADWKFTCVHLEQDSQVQLLSVHIDSVDGQKIDDAAFSVQFRQIAPLSISHVDGVPVKSKSTSAPDSSNIPHLSLEDELAELEILKEQLLALEHSIALKITHISDAFHLDEPERLLQVTDCKGLKCFFSTIYNRVKAMASKIYPSGLEDESRANQTGILHWPSNHAGQRPLMEIDEVKTLDNVTSLQDPGHSGGQEGAEEPISVTDKSAGQPLQIGQSFIEGPHRVLHLAILVIVGLAIVINFAIMILIFQCVRLLRQRRQNRWEKRRSQLRESREACNALVATKYIDLVQWLRDGLRRGRVEDQEKDAIMRRIRKSHSDEESSDTLSISMEEEIAQFRAAAGVVGNLVTAEEGRGRSRFSLTRPRRASTPSSIMSSCPTYRSVDESLPAYDENCSPEYIDGFQYTPGSSTPGTSSPRRSSVSDSLTTCSSLDENVERKD
ncbi:hypothetical protein NUW58_g3054 [Xylaria curta]|uniref:Uncharacterized protein n=1 Tax=Xylaria curta TaxID=42375 RepID=A0ACC1PDN6_9PEZI|nr:hypothetical protein NUW58_g3054 [Xylaria curta]